MLSGQCGIARDVSGLPSHQLDQADTVVCSDRLYMGARDSFHRFRKGRFKTETLVEVHDIVIDGFRNADDAFSKIPTPDLRSKCRCTLEGSIPADDKKNVHAKRFQTVHHVINALGPARTTENRAAETLNSRNRIRPERQ